MSWRHITRRVVCPKSIVIIVVDFFNCFTPVQLLMLLWRALELRQFSNLIRNVQNSPVETTAKMEFELLWRFCTLFTAAWLAFELFVVFFLEICSISQSREFHESWQKKQFVCGTNNYMRGLWIWKQNIMPKSSRLTSCRRFVRWETLVASSLIDKMYKTLI